MREYFNSLRAYGGAIMKWWWALVVGVASGVVWLIQIWGVKLPDLLPLWLAPLLFIVGLGLAQFLAYHELRVRFAEELNALFGGLSLEDVQINKGIIDLYANVDVSLVFRNTTAVALRYEMNDAKIVVNQHTIPNMQLVNKGTLVATGQSSLFSFETIPGVPMPITEGQIAYTLTYGPVQGTQLFKSHRILKIIPIAIMGQFRYVIEKEENTWIVGGMVK